MNYKLKNSGIEWAEKIPQSWEVVPVKSILKKKKEILERWTNESVLSLTMNGVIVRDLLNPKGKMPATFDGYQIIDKGNLILCLFDIDVTPRCVGVANDDGVTSSAYSQYMIKWGVIQYYYYLLLMMDNDKVLLPYSKTLRSTLTDEYFGAVKVPITTDIKEQQAIADFLDEKVAKIDEIIADTKLSIEKLKDYKRSVITEAVTKGLNSNVRTKESGIEFVGEFPENWTVKPLKVISESNLETLSSNTDEDFEFNYVEIGSVTNERGIEKTEYILFKNAPSRARRVAHKGNIIISTVRTYLKAIARIEGPELIVSTGFSVLKAKGDEVAEEFLFHALKSESFTSLVSAIATGISYPAITNEKLMNIKIPIPDFDSQLRITKFLNEKISMIDSLIENKEALITKYEDYKKSMIYEYVTGKKQVV